MVDIALGGLHDVRYVDRISIQRWNQAQSQQ
jgi:hypothetical protein